MRELDTGAQEAFIKEVNEDLKNESLKKMWDKYGLYIIILVVAALTAAVSYESIKAWYRHRLQQWSDSYAYALSLQNQGKQDESLDSFAYIAGRDYGIFSELAKMQQANILLGQKKNDEAFALMEEIVNDKSFNRHLRDTVALKLASYKLEKAPLTEIEQLIGGIAGDNDNSWQISAQEMLALTNLRDGEIDKAATLYNGILANNKTPETVKRRIEDMLAVLPQQQ